MKQKMVLEIEFETRKEIPKDIFIRQIKERLNFKDISVKVVK